MGKILGSHRPVRPGQRLKAGNSNPPQAQEGMHDFVTTGNEQVPRQKMENMEECIAIDRHFPASRDSNCQVAAALEVWDATVAEMASPSFQETWGLIL